MRRPVVLDCDTGTDDAVAIMLAALHPGLELLGVTTVCGNTDVGTVTDNTLAVLEHIGRGDVPVHAGSARPLRPSPGYVDPPPDRLPLPPPSGRARPQPAVAWLVETARAAAEPVTLVATGPLTNLAAALEVDPGLVDVVDEVVVLGGAHAVGNVTASADRNFHHDAPAAAAVLSAGFERLVLVTLDATFGTAFTADQAEVLASLGTPAGTAAAAFLQQRIRDYAALPSMRVRTAAPVHDALAVAALLDNGLVTLRRVHVAVETAGELTYGRSVLDLEGVHGGTPNAHVALEADADGYFELLRWTFAAR